MRRYNHSREQQKRRIIHHLAERVKVERGEVWQTSYAIAKSLDLSPSSHFRSILAEMVQSGELIARNVNKPGRWQGLEYALKPGTYKLPSPRLIPIKAKGRQEGQLSLW